MRIRVGRSLGSWLRANTGAQNETPKGAGRMTHRNQEITLRTVNWLVRMDTPEEQPDGRDAKGKSGREAVRTILAGAASSSTSMLSNRRERVRERKTLHRQAPAQEMMVMIEAAFALHIPKLSILEGPLHLCGESPLNRYHKPSFTCSLSWSWPESNLPAASLASMHLLTPKSSKHWTNRRTLPGCLQSAPKPLPPQELGIHSNSM